MQGVELIFSIAVLVFSVIAHELAHGYVAEYLGDPTARLAGRLTWNPARHLDPVGSFLVPLFSFLIGGFVFGWAKPVPYNPYNLKNQRWGTALVAGSGAAVNLLIALFFSLVIRYREILSVSSTAFLEIAGIVVFLNILLAIFNLIPIPPLDGSKVLFSLLPYRFNFILEFMERYAIVLIIFLIFFIWQFFIPFVYFLFSLFTGAPF